MPIICISGFVGSGKTSVALRLAELLDYPHLNITFKDLAKKRGVSLREMQKLAETDKKIDTELDELIKSRAREMGNCVVSTWLGPWMIPESFKVWLKATPETRARRVAGREGIPETTAMEQLLMREGQNIERYKKLYSIDISKHEMFDMEIDTEDKGVEEVAGAIARELKDNDLI